MNQIHPNAVIHPKAKIGQGVIIGPFCVVEEGSEIGDGCILHNQVFVGEGTRMGKRNEIFSGAIVGGRAQHRNADQHDCSLVIGNDNVIREYVTMHKSAKKGGFTIVGNKNYIMSYVHIGHDCRIGDEVTMANATSLGGHTEIESNATLSVYVLTHQFVKIGRLAMIGASAVIKKDVPPFMLVGETAKNIGSINVVGMRRAGFGAEAVREIKQAYRTYFLSGVSREDALTQLDAEIKTAEGKEFITFIRASKRGVLTHRRDRFKIERDVSAA
jgi:UDP-N-acetylglucosamine acyltransferase